MINKETVLEVADNTGVKNVRCIHIYGSTGKTCGGVGDIIACSAINVIPGSSIKKGEVCRALIVRTRKNLVRKDGSFISFKDNAVVIIEGITGDVSLKGTRVFGSIPREIQSKCSKAISLAENVL